MNRSNIKFAVSVFVGTWLMIYALRLFDLRQAIAALRNAREGYLAFAFLLLVFAYLLRGLRWLIWEEDLRFWDSFKLILVGFMGNNILPARLGEILRAHVAADRIRNEYGRTATLASIVIERVLDAFVIAGFGLLGLILVHLSGRYFWVLLWICVAFLAITVFFVLGVFRHEGLKGMLYGILKIFPGKIKKILEEKTKFFIDGLVQIRSVKKMAYAMAASLTIWGIELAMYYLIVLSILPGASLGVCLIFLAAVNFASLFPLTVGGIGAIESVTTLYLVNAGWPESRAFAVVLVQHAYQFVFTTVAGLYFYYADGYYNIPVVRRRPRELKQPQ